MRESSSSSGVDDVALGRSGRVSCYYFLSEAKPWKRMSCWYVFGEAGRCLGAKRRVPILGQEKGNKKVRNDHINFPKSEAHSGVPVPYPMPNCEMSFQKKILALLFPPSASSSSQHRNQTREDNNILQVDRFSNIQATPAT